MADARAAHFDALVEAHGSGVYRLCRAILRDDHLGADAAQEAFLRLWRRLDAGASTPERLENVGAWLRKAALSSALDLARRRQVRERSIEARAVESWEEAPDDPQRAPPASAARKELDGLLALALRDLPEGQRTIFLLRHEGGLSLREVAATLEIETTTVKTQFARACLKLQGRLRFLQDRETQP